MLLADSIRIRASACASADRGRWTAIWSPSKSALKAVHTSGWTWMALPSTSTGSNAWMPRRWSVGARLRSTGCSLMTPSSTSQTCGRRLSTMRFADLMFWASSWSTSRFMTNGLNSSSAISFGQAALVELEGRADDDDRPARVVDALSEQVLTEPALLALQHVGQALERPVAGTR